MIGRPRAPLAKWVAFAALGFVELGCLSSGARREIASAESVPEVRERAPSADPPEAKAAPPPRPPAPSDAELAGSVDLPALEAAAIARHPSLVEAAHRVRALTARARADGSLPPPELMAEIWQVPIAHPFAFAQAGMAMLTVRQEFPAIGARDLDAEATALDARAAAATIGAQSLSLVREVDRSFADYVEATQRHSLHVEHHVFTLRVESAARARFAGAGGLAAITRAELETSRMEADIEREAGTIGEAKARLNGLLARPIDAPLGPPRVSEPVTVALTAAEISERAGATSPEIAASKLSVESAERTIRARDREATIPSFTVGASFFPAVRDMPTGYGASLAMSLPWLSGGGSARVRSAEETALAARAATASASLRVRSEIAKALAAVKTAERRFVTLRERTEPSALRSLGATESAYAAGAGDLLGWLDAARTLLDVELELIGARGDLARALADLDGAAGMRVARSPLPALTEAHHEH